MAIWPLTGWFKVYKASVRSAVGNSPPVIALDVNEPPDSVLILSVGRLEDNPLPE